VPPTLVGGARSHAVGHAGELLICRVGLGCSGRPDVSEGPRNIVDHVWLYSPCLRPPHGERRGELPRMPVPIVIPALLLLLPAGHSVPRRGRDVVRRGRVLPRRRGTSRRTRSGGTASYTSSEWRTFEPLARQAEVVARVYPDRRDVFLCHAWDDRQGAAKELCDLLISYGATVWFSEYDVGLGKSLLTEIDKGLRTSRAGIVLVTPAVLKTLEAATGIASKELAALLATDRVIPVAQPGHAGRPLQQPDHHLESQRSLALRDRDRRRHRLRRRPAGTAAVGGSPRRHQSRRTRRAPPGTVRPAPYRAGRPRRNTLGHHLQHRQPHRTPGRGRPRAPSPGR
jgi:hypothetical protein